MNDLNSVLIEGIVYDIKKGESITWFELCNQRKIKNNNEIIQQDFNFSVLIDKKLDCLKDQDKVRIIGRLKKTSNNKVYIHAEHINQIKR